MSNMQCPTHHKNSAPVFTWTSHIVQFVLAQNQIMIQKKTAKLNFGNSKMAFIGDSISGLVLSLSLSLSVHQRLTHTDSSSHEREGHGSALDEALF